MSKIVVSVIGAGGKMGARTSNNLAKKPDEFELLMAEASEAGIKSIKERGFEPVPVEVALAKSDVVVFAVPDTLIETVGGVCSSAEGRNRLHYSGSCGSSRQGTDITG
ncbi:MAG: hypothetical protein ACLVE3_02715 [[Clostridium] scindens]